MIVVQEKKAEQIGNRLEELRKTGTGRRQSDIDWLSPAARLVIDCRQVLMWTYCYAYFLDKATELTELFQAQQATPVFLTLESRAVYQLGTSQFYRHARLAYDATLTHNPLCWQNDLERYTEKLSELTEQDELDDILSKRQEGLVLTSTLQKYLRAMQDSNADWGGRLRSMAAEGDARRLDGSVTEHR